MQDWSALIENLQRNYSEIFRHDDATSNHGFSFVDGYNELARGFKKAGDLVADNLAKNYNGYTAEMLPAMLALYRHAVELYLKSMRHQLSTRVSETYSTRKSHNLLELWQPIEIFLRDGGFEFQDGQLHYRVGRLVEEFSTVDGFGDRFRYPDSKEPSSKLGLWTNYEALKLSIAEVDLLSFGFLEIVSYLRPKNEF